MSKYLRLTIDVAVADDEFAELLLEQEALPRDLQQNIEAWVVEIDGYSDVEDHGGRDG